MIKRENTQATSTTQRALAAYETPSLYKLIILRPLSTQPPGKRKIFWLNSDTLSVDSGKIGVYKEGDEVSLSGFLKSHDGR